jgi:Glycosyl transferase family 2
MTRDRAGILVRPSWPRPGRGARILALLALRDEERFLPGFLANVGAQVDGIVALDDRSGDGSRTLLESSPEVLEVLSVPSDRSYWDEPANYRALVEAGLRHGAEWLISLDADERLERFFGRRVHGIIRQAERRGIKALTVRLHELWDSPDRYRVDGLWGAKAPPRLFRAEPGQSFDDRRLHAPKVPVRRGDNGVFPHADLRVYHLRMIRPADRMARRRRYERLDPEARFQPEIGYAYLTDETGLELRRVPWLRGYREGVRLPSQVARGAQKLPYPVGDDRRN